MPDKKNINQTAVQLETLDLRKTVNKPSEDAPSIHEEPVAPEKTVEQVAKNIEGQKNKGAIVQEQASLGGIVSAGQEQAFSRQRFEKIEKIMEEGLKDMYLAMDESSRLRFKKAGEEAGQAINDLFIKGKSTARKVLDIIKKWLSLIPGINSFFLEQEAKIKTDKIMNAVRQYEQK